MREKTAEIQVSEGGGEGNAPGTGEDILLQILEKTGLFPEIHGGFHTRTGEHILKTAAAHGS